MQRIEVSSEVQLGGPDRGPEPFTPVDVSQSGSGTHADCLIVNVGTKPIEVSARFQSFTDGSDITAGSTCPVSPATLAPGAGGLSAAPAGDQVGYCHFTATSSKVRAELLVFNLGSDVTSALPATK